MAALWTLLRILRQAVVYEQPINTVHTVSHKKSHFPHFSSTVVFHLQSKSNKRMSRGFGREPSPSWEWRPRQPHPSSAGVGLDGRGRETQNNLPSSPGAAQLRRDGEVHPLGTSLRREKTLQSERET